MKVRDVIRRVEEDGWRMLARKGTGHRQYRHPAKKGRVTIAGHPGDDVDTGTLVSIFKQAGLVK